MKRLVSNAFVEDSLVFLFTVPALVYIFGPSHLLLLTSVHLLSIPCSGASHSALLGPVQSFLLTFSTLLAAAADSVAIVVCSCEFTLSDFCCRRVGPFFVGCLQDDYDASFRLPNYTVNISLAFVLLPVAAYNLLKDTVRVVQIWTQSDGDGEQSSRAGATLAWLLCVKIATLIITSAGDSGSSRNAWNHALNLVVSYSLFSCVVAAANWKTHSLEALHALYFLDCCALVLYGAASVQGKVATLGVYFTACAFCISGTLLVQKKKETYFWSQVYIIYALASIAYLSIDWWDRFSAISAAVMLAYAGTTFSRYYLLHGESSLLSLCFAIMFLFLDVIFVSVIWLCIVAGLSKVPNIGSGVKSLIDMRSVLVLIGLSGISIIVSSMQINRKASDLRFVAARVDNEKH